MGKHFFCSIDIALAIVIVPFLAPQQFKCRLAAYEEKNTPKKVVLVHVEKMRNGVLAFSVRINDIFSLWIGSSSEIDFLLFLFPLFVYIVFAMLFFLSILNDCQFFTIVLSLFPHILFSSRY